MFGTMHRSFTGLMANTMGLNVVSNNLANSNTVGFKASRPEFAQMMANSMNAISGNNNPLQVGLGVRTNEVGRIFSQGALRSTGIGTNLALQGNGFFQVVSGGETMYTRAGNFGLDNSGFLVTPSGARVQGFSATTANGTTTFADTPSDIAIDPQMILPGEASTSFSMTTNLSANAVEGETYSTTRTVYDSGGTSRSITVTYTKGAEPGAWDYQYTSGDGQVANGSGTLTFDANGQLATMNGQAVTAAGFTGPTITVTGLPAQADGTATADLSLAWDLGTADGRANLTGLGETSTTNNFRADGFSNGTLQNISFSTDGTVQAIFNNGRSMPLARVAIGIFNNNQGLRTVNEGGYFAATEASGAVNLNSANANRASVFSGSVEIANVDTAEQMTDMILYQRGFQSGSKSIQTADQVLQEMLSLKR